MAEASISVVMPTYNRAAFICAALDSLALQSYPAVEVLVVDDRSTDDTRARVEGHALAPRIRYHLQTQNQGASVARNVGVDMASGEVIVFLDSDDLLAPQHHRRVAEAFETSERLGLYSCDARMIGPTGESIAEHTWTTVQCHIKGRTMGSGRRSLADVYLFPTPFPGLSVRRSAYRSIGGLDQSLFPLDDFDLQLRMAGAGFEVHYEHLPLAFYRIHGGNESGREQAVRVCTKKLRCIQLARQRHPEIRALPATGRRREGEVRRELAYALLQNGDVFAGAATLLRALFEDPHGLGDLFRVAVRRLRRLTRSRAASWR